MHHAEPASAQDLHGGAETKGGSEMNKRYWDHSGKPSVFVEVKDGVEVYRGPFSGAKADKYAEKEKEIEELRRERDEAREAIIGWENKWKCAVEMAARAELERDEARELCRELTDLVAYGLGQSGEPWSLDAMRKATELIRKN
jgi:hypothetical protein